MTRRTIKLIALALAVILPLVLLIHIILLAQSDPIVRQATMGLPDWPEGTPPVRIALLSDIHVAGPDMPPSRLARIVAQVNGLAPDIVLIADDVISDKTLVVTAGLGTSILPLRLGVRPGLWIVTAGPAGTSGSR
ncbi:MAG TPA: hypothetical protein VIG90_07885 [Pedomonas sp.]|uniref:hypothetical protein n=1 Tax=Pedomonas sp. TaxID=2976421 RepID=UPI002F3EF98B